MRNILILRYLQHKIYYRTFPEKLCEPRKHTTRNHKTLEGESPPDKERSEFHVLASIAGESATKLLETYAANHTGRNALSGVK